MSQSFANIAVEQGIISVDTTAFIICAPGDVITMNIERSYDAGVANQDLVCMDFAVMAAPLLPVYVP